LSRLGGGIGTRGPGEKKLEVDRRLIRDRISQLKKELEDIERSRQTTRNLRSSNKIPVVAIVGYTNAGKSTLLNKLTGAGILAEDKLFATLDPTTRNLQLDSGTQVLFTDTVGFIRKLPHHLIEAFKSTLEEAKYADIILHVVDGSNPDYDKQMKTVYETLKRLGVENKTIITAFNKVDKIEDLSLCKDEAADKVVCISAKHGDYLPDLLDIIEQVMLEQKVLMDEVLPYDMAGIIQDIRKYGQLLVEEYVQDGIRVKAYVPKELDSKIKHRRNGQ
jgi:GTP-binding protein HflX